MHQNSNIPIYTGDNYAPVKPLLELKHTVEPKRDDLNNQIRALYNELNNCNDNVFEAIAETAYVIAAFTQGRQIWERNWYKGGRWELAAPDPNANPNKVRAFNKMQFQISQMLEDLISSNPDFEPADMFKSWRHEKQVKASKAVWNEYERKFYDAWFNNQQAHSLITTGTAIEELIYDPGVKGPNVYKEIWGTQTIRVSEGGGECFECGLVGTVDDFYQWDNVSDAQAFKEVTEAAEQGGDDQAIEQMMRNPLYMLPQCSQCGSFQVQVDDAIDEEVPSVVGMQQFQLGDFRLNNLPIQACRFDLSVRPEDSTWFIDKQYCPIRKVKYMFGRDLQIGEGKGDEGLEYLRKMPLISQGFGVARMGTAEASSQKSAVMIKMSLSAEELSEIDIPKNIETISGKTLKEGGTLADMFPEGATILGFNDLEVIYGIYGKHHSKRISSAVYFSKPNSGTGRGAEDLAEMQKRVNKLDAQQVAAVEGASPGYAYMEGSIDEKYLKRMHFPNARTPVKMDAFARVEDISKIVRQFEPQQVNPQFFAYAQELEKMMQMTAHNVTMSGSVFDVNNSTATGARILEATAQAISIPMLQSKAGCRKGTVKNLLCGYREIFASTKRTFGVGSNKRFTQLEISGEDIDPGIEFVVVENSPIPQNFYLRKVDYMAFSQAVNQIMPQGGYLALKQADPELLKVLAKTFGVDIGPDEYDQISELCRSRLQNAFELAPMMAEMLAAQVQEQSFALTEGVQPNMMPMGAENSNMLMSAPPQPQDDVEVGLMAEQQAAQQDKMLFDLVFGALDIPIRPKEKNHAQKVEWFKDFLDSQDGMELSPIERDVCFEFIYRHENAERTAMIVDQGMMQMDAIVAAGPAEMIQAKGEQMAEMGAMPPMPPSEDVLLAPEPAA